MVSKNQIKLIRKLAQKKYRNQLQLFIVEGKKSILEFVNAGYELHSLFCTDLFFKIWNQQKVTFVDDIHLKKISSLKNPDEGLAIFHMRSEEIPQSDITVALDDVRDPGNLGTIIRLCDWFGITELVCSEGTVDCYNSKVIQATMGSLTRVNVRYTNLEDYLKSIQKPIIGAVMNGENVYQTQLPKKAVLVMGNEANGVSEAIQSLVTKSVTIPKFGTLQQTESLNVAMATSILLSELKRR